MILVQKNDYLYDAVNFIDILGSLIRWLNDRTNNDMSATLELKGHLVNIAKSRKS